MIYTFRGNIDDERHLSNKLLDPVILRDHIHFSIRHLIDELDKKTNFIEEMAKLLKGEVYNLDCPKSFSGILPGIEFVVSILLGGDLEIGKFIRINLIHEDKE
jgi:hypothetical protein